MSLDLIQNIENDLHIPVKCAKHTRGTHYACLVPKKWVTHLYNGRYVEATAADYEGVAQLDPLHLVAQSTSKLPTGWTRVTIQCLERSDRLIHSLVERSLSVSDSAATQRELSHQNSQRIHTGLWKQACKHYSHAIWPTKEELHKLPCKVQAQVTRCVLRKLFRCPLIGVSQGCSPRSSSSKSYRGDLQGDLPHPGMLNPYVILESNSAFYLVFPFEQFTLWNSVLFSPAKLGESSVKSLFVFYQILQCIHHYHRRGVSLGVIHLNDFYLDERSWVQFSHPDISKRLYSLESTETDVPIYSVLSTSHDEVAAPPDLPQLVQAWMLGELSNFDYLMALNGLAGRRMHDPNHHPILPWVTDFKSPNSGFRDLAKSKYRLNKGDGQLDVTYNPEDPLKDPLQVAHHIAEVLSDITYYVYRARQIPKSVLTAHVRQRWVPHEYPASMERLQEWTPDECIPEFYTDPGIFRSIHRDLPDLAIPAWATSPEDFIAKHREILESDYVSQRLHHWIDLTFGYKLTGSSAVKAKNVCLQLVDQHTHLLSYGVVQLFNHPHPPRVVSTQAAKLLGQTKDSFKSKCKPKTTVETSTSMENGENTSSSSVSGGDKMPSEATIVLPSGYQPVLALNHLEALYEFSERVAGKLPEPPVLQVNSDHVVQDTLVAMDMQVLGCLLVELYLSPNTRALGYGASLQQRYLLVRSVCNSYWQELPRSVREAVELLLRVSRPWSASEMTAHGALFMYEPVSDQGLPPPNIDHLLHPTFSPVNFPPYFRGLYLILYKLRQMEQLERSIDRRDSTDVLTKIRQLKRLSKQRVSLLGHYLYKAGRQLGADGVGILLPYVMEVMESPATSVQAAWCLFNPVAQVLSRPDTETHFLSRLQKLFDAENTTPKYIKVYHRSFVMQLIIRLGLKTVLDHIVTYLIEAIGGYKNYFDDDMITRQLSQETDSLLGGHGGGQTDASQQQISIDSVEDALIYSFGEDEEEEEEEGTNEMLDDVFDNRLLLGDVKQCGEDDTDSQRSSDTLPGPEVRGGGGAGRADQDGDTTSGSSNEASSSDQLSKSIGRLSVHSVSRLMTSDAEGGDDVSISDDDSNHTDTTDDNGSQPPPEPTNDHPPSSTPTNDHPPSSMPARTMVHSDTEDFTTIMSGNHDFNISNVASETIKWLAHRLGPVLTAKHLSKNLLRMLMLCYMGREQLQATEREGECLGLSEHHIVGDLHAEEVLECLSFIVVLYGEQVILLQYFQHTRELIQSAVKKLTVRAEAGLISCASLLVYVLPYLSDATLMGILQDTIFVDIVLQMMKLVSSTFISFPSGSLSRGAICYKLVNVLYVISLRIGFEMTREHMTYVLQKFFAAFNRIYEDPNRVSGQGAPLSEAVSNKSESEVDEGGVEEEVENLYCEVKLDARTKEYSISTPVSNDIHRHRRQGSLHRMLSPTAQEDPEDAFQEKTKDLILQELRETFTPELAHTAYIPFCKLAGGIYLEQNLINEDLIRKLCMIHDQSLTRRQQEQSAGNATTSDSGSKSPTEDGNLVSGSFGRNVSFSGNKIMIQEEELPPGVNHLDTNRGSHQTRRKSTEIAEDKLRSQDMKYHNQRHLKGNWLAYWEHEVGLSDRENAFNFKQIKLQSFVGHTSSVRAIYVLDNENSFVSASKDKTVKLWSLRNAGDGSERESPKWTYRGHKKSVFSVTFMEATHHVVSCDTNIHIWDPFMERTVAIVEASKSNPVTAMCTMPAPSTSILTTGPDSILKFLDGRTGHYSHQYKCTTNPAGVVRCMSLSRSGWTVAVGYSSGVISTLDTRTGSLIASWKGHEGEILQTKFLEDKLVSSCFDQTMSMWNTSGERTCSLKGTTEPVHCMNFYRDSLVSATTANRIGVHESLDKNSLFTSSKLRSDAFRGVLTTMAVLPLNKLLLLGSDNGEIGLVA